jgi:hypothetical protein
MLKGAGMSAAKLVGAAFLDIVNMPCCPAAIHYYQMKHYDQHIKAAFDIAWPLAVKAKPTIAPIAICTMVAQECLNSKTKEFCSQLNATIDAHHKKALADYKILTGKGSRHVGTAEDIQWYVLFTFCNSLLMPFSAKLKVLLLIFKISWMLCTISLTLLLCSCLPVACLIGTMRLRRLGTSEWHIFVASLTLFPSIHTGETIGLVPRKWYKHDPTAYQAAQALLKSFAMLVIRSKEANLSMAQTNSMTASSTPAVPSTSTPLANATVSSVPDMSSTPSVSHTTTISPAVTLQAAPNKTPAHVASPSSTTSAPVLSMALTVLHNSSVSPATTAPATPNNTPVHVTIPTLTNATLISTNTDKSALSGTLLSDHGAAIHHPNVEVSPSIGTDWAVPTPSSTSTALTNANSSALLGTPSSNHAATVHLHMSPSICIDRVVSTPSLTNTDLVAMPEPLPLGP